MEEVKSKNKIRIYKNYKRNNKWLGLIDYKTLCFLIVYVFLMLLFLKYLPINTKIKIYTFVISVIPVVSLFVINSSGESAIDTLIVVLKFVISKKVFVKICEKSEFKYKKYIKLS